MNELFHYYAVQFLSRQSGFSHEDAKIIAYSCHLVDRAIVPLTVIMESGEEFRIQATHHFGFWDAKQEFEVWIPFHFFPAADTGPSLRIDGRKNPLLVRPNSDPVKELLVDALKSRNLYRIGIALHSYADSWAHQNFVGRNSSINKIDSLSPIPAIGHAHLGRVPDIWNKDWDDPRLIAEHRACNNHARFMLAAEKVYKYLATFKHRPFADWELLRFELEALVLNGEPELGSESGGEPEGESEKASVRADSEMETEFKLKLNDEPLDEGLWFRNAGITNSSIFSHRNNERIAFARHEIRRLLKFQQLPPIKVGPEFRESHIYQWSLAVREHRQVASRIIEQM